MEIKIAAVSIANRTGILDLYAYFRRQITKSQVAILMYHRVGPGYDGWSLKPLNPRTFENQMQYFSRHFNLISLNELAQYLHQMRPLPKNAAVITFDDGYKDNYFFAYPILNKYHIPATIFLTTGYCGSGDLLWTDAVRYIVKNSSVKQLTIEYLGSWSLQSEGDKIRAKRIIVEELKKLPNEKRIYFIEEMFHSSHVNIPSDIGKEMLLSWNEIREMSDGGIDFGAHTINHPILTNLPLEQAKFEIVQSKQDIEEKLGKEVTTFAYPNGDYNANIVKFVKESGFTCAVTTSSRLISSKDNLYELGRIGAGEDFNKFKVMFSGLWEDLQGTVLRIRR